MVESVGGFKVLGSFFCEDVTGFRNRGQLPLCPRNSALIDKVVNDGGGEGDLKRDESVDFLPKRQKLFFLMPLEMPLHVLNNCNALLKFSLSS